MRSRAYIFAIITAIVTLLLVMSGGAVTSLHDQPHQAEFDRQHLFGSIPGFIVILVLAILAAKTRARVWGWMALVLATVQGGIGHHSSGPILGTIHATLGAVLFTVVAAVALMTSAAWDREPELVRDYGWPSLR